MSELTRAFDELPVRLTLPEAARSEPARAVRFRPPGSKSLTNRALLLAALADGESVLRGALTQADDAQRMIMAVTQLGAAVDVDGGTVRVRGVGGRWKVGDAGVTLDLNNAGTATRFLAASVLASKGAITVTGNERMRQRPIGELVAILGQLGVRANFLGGNGCPPVRLTPPSGTTEGRPHVSIPTTQSSQFISALLLVGSVMEHGIQIELVGEITSASYIRMTIRQMRSLGISIEASGDLRTISVSPGLSAFETDIEPDASGACFWWAAGALRSDLRVFVGGIPAPSVQGDTGFPAALGRMGCSVMRQGDGVAVVAPDVLRGAEIDLKDMPDAGPALAVVAAFADGPTVIRGVRTLRVKETDRIAAVRSELAKIGGVVEEDFGGDPDVMRVVPDADPGGPVSFATYDDHRMAMSLALVSLRRAGVTIEDPTCVGKTYPTFWAEWARLVSARSESRS